MDCDSGCPALEALTARVAALEALLPKRRKTQPPPKTWIVPPELTDLPLYAGDWQLCRQWPELLENWARAFPGVHHVAEVRKAHAWEVANTGHRKNAHGRFLTNWMNRAQERASRNGGGIFVSPSAPLSKTDW